MKFLKFILLFFTLTILTFSSLILYKFTSIFNGRFNLSPYKNSAYNKQDIKLNIKPNPILKDNHGYTTILLVGVDTRKNSHLFNTDTIMTVTYSWKTHKLIILSYPRDLYVKYPDTYYHFKINAVYAYGERVFKTDGMQYLKKAIKQISGLDPQYNMLIDFQGFKDLINLLGGVKIYVPRAFTDYAYPNGRGGYMKVHFDKGWQTLNGDRALIYARSRHAAGPEGSDFARAKRQQLIIEAIANQVKDKIKKDPAWAYKMFQNLNHYVMASKISPNEVKTAIDVYLKKGMPKIYSQVLTPATAKGTLLMSQANPLYIIVPRAGQDNWTYVKKYVQTYLAYPATVTKEPIINFEYHTIANANKTLSLYNKTKSTFYWLTLGYPHLNKTSISDTTLYYTKNNKDVADEIRTLLFGNATVKLLQTNDSKTKITIAYK